MFVASNINELIGKTPMLDITSFYQDGVNAKILSKLEFCNPTSIKDRGVFYMLQAAHKAGKIKTGTEVVEASSGNTGIALARAAATMGVKARIYMSELCSV